jgi:hypothetical protein
MCDVRWFSASQEPRRFWSWVRNRYQIDDVDADGHVRRRLTRNVSWFEPWLEEMETRSGVPTLPQPYLMSVDEDSTGRIWVNVRVADAHWSAANAPRRHQSAADVDHAYDTIIEVLDPSGARVLATERFSDPIVMPLRGLAYRYRDTPDGRVLIDVLQLILEVPRWRSVSALGHTPSHRRAPATLRHSLGRRCAHPAWLAAPVADPLLR